MIFCNVQILIYIYIYIYTYIYTIIFIYAYCIFLRFSYSTIVYLSFVLCMRMDSVFVYRTHTCIIYVYMCIYIYDIMCNTYMIIHADFSWYSSMILPTSSHIWEKEMASMSNFFWWTVSGNQCHCQLHGFGHHLWILEASRLVDIFCDWQNICLVGGLEHGFYDLPYIILGMSSSQLTNSYFWKG